MPSLDGPGVPVSLRARIRAADETAPSSTRAQGRRAFHLLVILAVVLDVALFQLAGGLAHSRDRPLAVTAWLADAWALATGALTWLTAKLASPFVQGAEVLALACVAAPLVLWALMVHASALATWTLPAAADLPCFAATLLGAAPFFASAFWTRRRSEPGRPRVLGGAIGCCAAAWAGVLVLLWCPQVSRSHALLGHVAPIAAATFAGTMTGGPVLRLRGRQRAQ